MELMQKSHTTKLSLSVATLNVLIVCTFGSQNLVSYFQSTSWMALPLCAICSILVPVLCAETLWYRRASGVSWHDRYASTFLGWICLGIYYACFWAFAVHAATLIFTWQCDICSGNPAEGKAYFSAAYWLHVFPSLLIALASPLQFTPSIRKLRGYSLHRWIGRSVILASVVHQASATVLFVSELLFSKVDCSLLDAVELGQCGWLYRFYVSGFVPKNVLCWTAIVRGVVTARRKRFAEHGRWMYRLAAMWIITIVVAHFIIYPVGFLVGPEKKYAVGEWAEWLFVIPMELYIRRSGRFPLPQSDAREAEVTPKPKPESDLERPFLSRLP